MKLINYFEPARFGLLLRTELLRSKKGILMALVIIFGLHLAGMITELILTDIRTYDSHEENFSFVLMVSGLILSSLAFRNLGNTLKSYHYLTLPASALEKFASMWLLTSAGWIVLLTVAQFIYVHLINFAGSLVFTQITFGTFNPFGEVSLTAMKHYFVIQGIFLAGAAHFKGYVFPKTLLTLIVAGLVCGIIGYLFMADLIRGNEECFTEPQELKTMTAHKLWLFARSLFWWALAPLCWLVTYLAIKEKEV